MEGSENRAADQTRDGSPTCGTRAVRQIGDKGSPLHLGSGHLHPGSELLPHRGSGLLGSSQPPLGGVQPRLGSGQPRLGTLQSRLGNGHHLHGGDHGGESAVGITEDVADSRKRILCLYLRRAVLYLKQSAILCLKIAVLYLKQSAVLYLNGLK